MSTRFVLVALIALCVVLVARGEDGFEPIFDGKTLEGWETPDPSYWTVEDEAITARITPEHPCTVNQYLVWEGGELKDFELKLKYRMVSAEEVNGGFQFRSKVLPDHDVAGYQVDNDPRGGWLVRLYDEHGRHDLALRGQKTVIDENGARTLTEIPEAVGDPKFKLDEWHEYHLTCVGPRLTLKVNGELVAEVIDNDPKEQDLAGILALQLHSNPPVLVQFKDIQLKRLE